MGVDGGCEMAANWGYMRGRTVAGEVGQIGVFAVIGWFPICV